MDSYMFLTAWNSYFLQVCSESRHCGLGKQLIQQLLSVSGQWCMRKLMLAVLKSMF